MDIITAQQARLESSFNSLSWQEQEIAKQLFKKIRDRINDGYYQYSDHMEVGTGVFSSICNFFQAAGYEVDFYHRDDTGFAWVVISW